MKRRFVLAIVLMGALSAPLPVRADQVVTLPLNPPKAKPAEEKPPAKPTPAETQSVTAPEPKVEKNAALGTQSVATEPLSPQAIIDIPPPAFTTEPLFPPGLALDVDAMPTPALDRALLEAKEKPAAMPPLPKPKPPAPPTLTEQAAPVSTPEKKPLPRGVMEPIDDYRPPKRPAVVIDHKALEQSLTPAAEKPATARLPQPKPAPPKTQKKVLAKGEMEPIDDMPGPKALITPRGKASTFRCFVRDVMAFYDRTHIRCYNKAKNKLNFFAVDTGQPISATLLEKGLAAMQAGKPATIVFAPEADLNPSNCAPANCRRLIDIQN